MGTVSPLAPLVNGTPLSIEQVIDWTKSQSTKGDMTEASANVRITALRQMHEQIAEDEAKDARFVLDNMDRLVDRWLRRNQDGKASTANTYASRARSTIEEYLRWAASPRDYDPKRREVRAKSDDPKKTSQENTAREDVPTVTSPVEIKPKSLETRNFPLDEEKTIVFVLPAGGVTFAEVKKFAVHLFTLAKDFNIADEHQAKTFAMVVRGDAE